MVLSLVLAKPAFCWQERTHKQLNGHAVALGWYTGNSFTLDAFLKDQLRLKNGIAETIGGRAIEAIVQDAGVSEDVPLQRSYNHFHDPLKPSWAQAGLETLLASGQSSLLWTQMPKGQQRCTQRFPSSSYECNGFFSWHDARGYYRKAFTEADKGQRDDSLALTFRAIGQIMHLVEDAAVPDHTRNHVHLQSIENWVETSANLREVLKIRPGSFSTAELQLLLGPSPDPQAPIPIAGLIDTNRYTGSNPLDTWSPVIGLAEFSNANFVTEGTIFTKYLHPKVEDTWAPDSLPGYRSLVRGGVTIPHLVAVGDRSTDPLLPGPQLQYSLDAKCYADYAALLIPKAIQYAAAIPYYFFRGKLEVEFVEATSASVKFKLRNLSPDRMGSGKLSVYYDAVGPDGKAGERKLVTEFPSLDPLEVNEQGPELSFTVPDDRFEDTYTLVFEGPLGLETNGVIGKVIDTSPTYETTPIEYPGAYSTQAFTINNNGAILGLYDSGDQYFILANNQYLLIGLNAPTGTWASLSDMNDVGQVVGSFPVLFPHYPGIQPPYYYWMGVVFPGPVTFRTDFNTLGVGINNKGQVVGCYWDQNPTYQKSYLLSGGTFTTLAVPGRWSCANDINDREEIVGTLYDTDTGFILSQGVVTRLAAPGSISTEAMAINNHGQIAGYSYPPNSGRQGFVYSKGKFITIPVADSIDTVATGINDKGDVVGYYFTNEVTQHGNRVRGFIGKPVKPRTQ